MKACVLSEWCHLEMKDIPMPVLDNDEVLVEVIYAGICGSDVTVFNHRHLTATIPRILCHEILGRVKEIKSDRELPYKVGDKVVVFPLIYCGKCTPCMKGHTSACSHLQIMGLHVDGGFAEYCKADVDSIIPISEDIPDRIAALTEPLSVAFHANTLGHTSPGVNVLVTGGGFIGILCAITAKYFGAKQVILTEINEERIKTAESMGGIIVINPDKQDALKEIKALTGGIGVDVAIEMSGVQASYDLVVPACNECATIVPVNIPSKPRSFMPNMFILKELTMQGTRCCPKNEFSNAATMMEDMYRRNLYPLENLIAAEYPLEKLAQGIAEQEEAKYNGKILINVKGT